MAKVDYRMPATDEEQLLAAQSYQAFEPPAKDADCDTPVANSPRRFWHKWQDASVFAKVIVLAVPLTGISLFCAWKLGGEMPAAEIQKSLEESIRARSAVTLTEDFRS